MKSKPELSFWQIWNMCFGFLGIQVGFALQNANVSRIFQTLGADIEDLPILWVAAPVTGLIVQPIIGHMSDNTWNRLGRRRPYFLVGALLSSLALFIMPNSPALWIAAGMLWIMDASINVAMEPFRAFVGDMLPERQRTTGYAMQSFFIGTGSVAASAAPWIMANWLDIGNTAPAGQIPDSVRYSFYLGGAALLLAVLWTVVSTREYSPQMLSEFSGASPAEAAIVTGGTRSGGGYLKQRGKTGNGFYAIVDDLFHMPKTMKQLAVVQFFSWFALFAMWIYTTTAVTSRHYGVRDTSSALFNEGANWVGILFASYNGFAALAAFVIPLVVRLSSRRVAHMLSLWLGGLGLMSFVIIEDPDMLLLSMAGVGIAWASIVSVPYSMLSSVLPFHKMGVYMGIFNFFIVIPQILAASVLGFLVRTLFDGEAIYALVLGGISMLLAGVAVLLVDEELRIEN